MDYNYRYKSTVVISAFPACGKSYMFKNYNGKPYTMLDSDSSEFSWIKDENGKNTKERNPEFPENYIKHIKDNIGKIDVIFVSSHEIVRKALSDNKINFFMVYPEKSMQEEWIRRFRERGNDENFIKFISDNWDGFIDNIRSEEYPNYYELQSDEYIGDILNYIIDENSMKSVKINVLDLEVNDMLCEYSTISNKRINVVTKIDADITNKVVYVYTNWSSWYFTFKFDDEVIILKY